MNVAYKRVVDGLRALGVDPKPLVPVQTAWISARDTTCAFEEALYEGGTIAPMIGSECVDRMTRARTLRLDAFLATAKAKRAEPAMAPVSSKVDAELNHVYGLLLKQKLTAAQRKALDAAELAWITYRDEACKVEGGTCLDELERERVAEIEAGWIGEQFW